MAFSAVEKTSQAKEGREPGCCYLQCSHQGCMRACSVVSDSLQPPWTVAREISSVHGIFQARILKWVAISYSKDLPNPGIEPMSLVSPAMAIRFLTWPQPKSTNWLA